MAWALKTIPLGPSETATTLASGTVSGSIGGVNDVYVNEGGTETGAVGAGHVIVQGVVASLPDLAYAASGYATELAASRFTRLCAEQGIGYSLVGSASDTPEMGPQPDLTITAVLQQVEDVDCGLLYETRSQYGLAYRTRKNMQNQSAGLTADYADATLAQPFAPTYDEQLVRNQITLTRGNGGSITGSTVVAEDDTDSMSVQDPPDGVGYYTYQRTVNANADSQLTNEAAWLLTLGTIDDFRYPQVTFDMTRSEVESLFADIPDLDVGDYFELTSMPAWMPDSTVDQLMFGLSEQLNAFFWTIQLNAVPESPYTGEDLPTW